MPRWFSVFEVDLGDEDGGGLSLAQHQNQAGADGSDDSESGEEGRKKTRPPCSPKPNGKSLWSIGRSSGLFKNRLGVL